MSSEPPFQIVDTGTTRTNAQSLFARVRKVLLPLLPNGAEVRHVGATALPGCLTKGDLDIVIRVYEADFRRVDAILATNFARNGGSIRTESFSAFEDESTDPHLGIQLVTIDGPHDFFHLFVEALQRSPELVREYNALKMRHNGSAMPVYRAAKDAFVQGVIAVARSDR